MSKKNGFDGEEILDLDEDNAHLLEVDESEAKAPVRTCIVSREKSAKGELIRFVLNPAREIVPDLAATLPGRGVWISARADAVSSAVQRKAFNRAFKSDVHVPCDLASRIEHLLKRDVIQRLSLAKKAGLIVLGFAKIEEAIRRGEIVDLLHAREASIDGVTKLRRRWQVSKANQDRTLTENNLSVDEISLATGSLNAIHVGIKDGGATTALLNAMRRYRNYCEAGSKSASASG